MVVWLGAPKRRGPKPILLPPPAGPSIDHTRSRYEINTIQSSIIYKSPNLNQSGPIHRLICNGARIRKRALPHRDSRNCQAIREQRRTVLERKQRLKRRHILRRLHLHIRNRLDDRDVLARDVRNVQALEARLARNRKGQRAVHGCRLRCRHRQGQQGRDVGANGGDIGTRAGDDEGLERSEGEGAGGSGKEGRGRGSLALDDAVPALLLAFLANDGRDERDERRIVVGREGVAGGLQGAEDDIGEGRGEGDGFVVGRGGEDVFAGLDGAGTEGGESVVGA